MTPDLIQQIEATARRENRRPSEVLKDARRRYMEEKSWVELVERGRENAKRLGMQESDVDRLISDYRAEKRGR